MTVYTPRFSMPTRASLVPLETILGLMVLELIGLCDPIFACPSYWVWRRLLCQYAAIRNSYSVFYNCNFGEFKKIIFKSSDMLPWVCFFEVVLFHIASYQRMLLSRKRLKFFSWISIQECSKDGLKTLMLIPSPGFFITGDHHKSV